jgi:hypothetical protein
MDRLVDTLDLRPYGIAKSSQTEHTRHLWLRLSAMFDICQRGRR